MSNQVEFTVRLDKSDFLPEIQGLINRTVKMQASKLGKTFEDVRQDIVPDVLLQELFHKCLRCDVSTPNALKTISMTWAFDLRKFAGLLTARTGVVFRLH